MVDLAQSELELGDLEKYLEGAGKFAEKVAGLIETSSSPCDRGGQAATNLQSFKSDIVLFKALLDSYRSQIQLTHANMVSLLGHIGYLTSEGIAFETLQNQSATLISELNAATQPLKDKLAGSGAIAFSQFVVEQRKFLDNACKHALTAVRTSQADLALISQALETAAGRPATSPSLMIPQSPAYHFPTSNTAWADVDLSYGYLVSLWDDAAFTTRYKPTGSVSNSNYITLATQRFVQLMNNEVCGNEIKPPTSFVVRKIVKGDEFRTLASAGKLDLNVGLEDVIVGGNRHTGGVRAVRAKNIQPGSPVLGQYIHDLQGAFLIAARYSVCNGGPGNECCPTCRVSEGQLGSVASNRLTALHLASRGQGFVPTRASGCPAGDVAATSIGKVDFEGTRPAATVSSCLVSMLTPRLNTRMQYLENAGMPDVSVTDAQVRNPICGVTPEVLAFQPMQGLPVLGTWALALDGVSAAQLNTTFAPSPTLTGRPGVSGATGVEVLFVVGVEPRGVSQPVAYTLN
jgi:hypothetical protein